MANVNAQTLNVMRRTQYFVRQDDGLRQLPYELVQIDYDFQAYEPVSLEVFDSKGSKRRGKLTAPVILDRDNALPRPVPPVPVEKFAVFECHGA